MRKAFTVFCEMSNFRLIFNTGERGTKCVAAITTTATSLTWKSTRKTVKTPSDAVPIWLENPPEILGTVQSKSKSIPFRVRPSLLSPPERSFCAASLQRRAGTFGQWRHLQVRTLAFPDMVTQVQHAARDRYRAFTATSCRRKVDKTEVEESESRRARS